MSEAPNSVLIDLPARGGAMAALEFGAAPGAPAALLFLHANGMHGGVYRRLLAPLGAHACVLAADLRGHGFSTLPTEPARLRNWMIHRDDVIALIEATARDPVVIAGHSMGATIAIFVAAARPELVRALLLADPVFLPAAARIMARAPWGPALALRVIPLARGAGRRRARFADRAAALEAYRGRGAFKTWPDEILADYVERGFKDADGAVELACAPAWEAANFSAHAHDPWRAARATRAPLTVLAGDVGSTFPPWAAARLARAAPQTRFHREPGTTHFLPMERPDVVTDALAEALRG